MKTSLNTTSLLFLCALIGAVSASFLASGCAGTPTKSSTGEYVDASIITAKVKRALLADDTVKS